MKDTDEKSEFSNVSSRFGFKNNRDLGDGLTGMFRLEYGLDGNFGLANSSTRIAYVGVKGDFGDIRLGNSWGPAYNFVGGKADVFTNTQSLAYDYLGTYRINNAIHYSNKAGNIKYQGAAQIGQGVEKTGVNKWIFGAGTELAPKTNIGAYYNTADASADGADSTGYGVGIDYSPTSDIYLAVSYSAVNSDNDADDVTGVDFAAVIGLSGVLGNGTTLRFEYGTVSPDDSVASGDITGTQIGLRRQFKSFNMFTWVYNSDSDTTSNAKTYIAGVRYDF